MPLNLIVEKRADRRVAGFSRHRLRFLYHVVRWRRGAGAFFVDRHIVRTDRI